MMVDDGMLNECVCMCPPFHPLHALAEAPATITYMPDASVPTDRTPAITAYTTGTTAASNALRPAALSKTYVTMLNGNGTLQTGLFWSANNLTLGSDFTVTFEAFIARAATTGTCVYALSALWYERQLPASFFSDIYATGLKVTYGVSSTTLTNGLSSVVTPSSTQMNPLPAMCDGVWRSLRVDFSSGLVKAYVESLLVMSYYIPTVLTNVTAQVSEPTDVMTWFGLQARSTGNVFLRLRNIRWATRGTCTYTCTCFFV